MYSRWLDLAQDFKNVEAWNFKDNLQLKSIIILNIQYNKPIHKFNNLWGLSPAKLASTDNSQKVTPPICDGKREGWNYLLQYNLLRICPDNQNYFRFDTTIFMKLMNYSMFPKRKEQGNQSTNGCGEDGVRHCACRHWLCMPPVTLSFDLPPDRVRAQSDL